MKALTLSPQALPQIEKDPRGQLARGVALARYVLESDARFYPLESTIPDLLAQLSSPAPLGEDWEGALSARMTVGHRRVSSADVADPLGEFLVAASEGSPAALILLPGPDDRTWSNAVCVAGPVEERQYVVADARAGACYATRTPELDVPELTRTASPNGKGGVRAILCRPLQAAEEIPPMRKKKKSTPKPKSPPQPAPSPKAPAKKQKVKRVARSRTRKPKKPPAEKKEEK